MAKTAGRLKIRLYTSAHIVFDGYVRVLPEQRLLDVLNGVLGGALRAKGEFLQVSEVELCSLDGRKVTLQSAYINRTNILFAREIEDGQTRQPGSEAGHKLYPFISKSAMAAKLYMRFYTLTGKMHFAEGEGVGNVLSSGMRFFPLTDAEIVSSEGSSESVGFVAVNKEQILSVEELGPGNGGAKRSVDSAPA